MTVGQEVYKKVMDSSIRGRIKELSGEEMVVIWQMPRKNVEIVEKVSSIGKEVFEAEFQLIRKYGPELRHLAPSKVEEVQEAMDYYGMPVKVGDYVIAMAGIPIRFRVEGEISKIYTRSGKENEGKFFVNITKNGTCNCMDADSRCFTLPERFSKAALAN